MPSAAVVIGALRATAHSVIINASITSKTKPEKQGHPIIFGQLAYPC